MGWSPTVSVERFQSISLDFKLCMNRIKCSNSFTDLLSKILWMFITSVCMCCLGDDLKKSCLRSRERSSFLWSYTNSTMWTSSRGGELMFPLICNWKQRSSLQKGVKLQNRFFSAKCSISHAISRAGKDVIGLSLLSGKINVHYFHYKVRLSDLVL